MHVSLYIKIKKTKPFSLKYNKIQNLISNSDPGKTELYASIYQNQETLLRNVSLHNLDNLCALKLLKGKGSFFLNFSCQIDFVINS